MPRKRKPIPPSVLRRLTKYLAKVQSLQEAGVEWVSSHELASALGLTGSTVRQDLSHLDFSGISKRGYATEGLRGELRGILGADKEWNLVVVGAGNMGRALALHEEFSRRGFFIRGVFDADPKKVGRRMGKLRVEAMEALTTAIQERDIDMGVIAVPPPAAQSVADILIASGVRGLLNLTLTHIVAPKRVTVIDARLVASLLELSHAIKNGH